jgi:putative ABC transport system permease protein
MAPAYLVHGRRLSQYRHDHRLQRRPRLFRVVESKFVDPQGFADDRRRLAGPGDATGLASARRSGAAGCARRAAASKVGSTRTTGAAIVVALSPSYTTAYPKQLRYLVGQHSGVLLAQQTAANLGAAPGSTVTIHLANGAAVRRVVAGVVDLPQADSFFQVVGTASGAGASAPPDNVIFVRATPPPPTSP